MFFAKQTLTKENQYDVFGEIAPQMAYEEKAANVAYSVPPSKGREEAPQQNKALRETETITISGSSVVPKWVPVRPFRNRTNR